MPNGTKRMNPEDGRTPMVTLKTVDRFVGLLIVGIVLFGSYSWWRATRRALERNGMMGTMPGMDPIWYLFGTLVATSVVFGVYVLSREQLADALSTATAGTATAGNDEGDRSDSFDRRSSETSERPARGALTNDPTSERTPALLLLPEDERRVVEPILESPGLTQVELRGRSGFSKAKVSQTVRELQDRGLIYREKQGRTYRVYPGELLKKRHQS